jgi:hypothetical protein
MLDTQLILRLVVGKENAFALRDGAVQLVIKKCVPWISLGLSAIEVLK